MLLGGMNARKLVGMHPDDESLAMFNLFVDFEFSPVRSHFCTIWQCLQNIPRVFDYSLYGPFCLICLVFIENLLVLWVSFSLHHL